MAATSSSRRGARSRPYLQSRPRRAPGRLKLYAKTVVAFALWAASSARCCLVQPGLALGRRCASPASCSATVLIGFCVQHDANHGAYFGTRRLNHLMGWTSDAFLGFSSYAWRVKHNVAHHTYTNVDGYDDDINQAPFARLTPNQAPKRWYRLQHIYIWPLYSLMVLRWQTGADVAALVRGRIGTSPIRPPRRWALAGLVGGKLIFISWAIVVPAARLPVVGRARRLSHVHEGRQPDHGHDVPARALRRGGRLRLGRRGDRAASASGRCTRSRRPSTSAPATSR